MDAERAYNNEVAARETRGLQMDQEALRLEKSLAEQSELVHAVCSRLEGISTPEQDDVKEARSEPEESLPQWPNTIRAFRKIIDRNNRRLADLTERLQL